MAKLRGLSEDGVFRKPFYARQIPDKGVFDSYEDFQRVGFSYKEDIRRTGLMERTNTEPGDIYGVFSSSGTTGDPTFYIFNKNDKRVHEEFVRTFFLEAGIGETEIGAVCAPVDTTVMAHTMMWEFTTVGAGYVVCPEPSPANVIRTVTTVPVTVVATRPSVVTDAVLDPALAEKAGHSHVAKLMLGGGLLVEGRRRFLEKRWHAACYDLHGMSEMFGPLAAECRCRNGKHYLHDYLLLEIVDPVTKQPVKPGERGVAVYTTLWDKGFPLLRYWTGDVMSVTFEPCPCGSREPRMFYYGRLSDCCGRSLEGNGRTADSYYGSPPVCCKRLSGSNGGTADSAPAVDELIFPRDVEDILCSRGIFGEYLVTREEDGLVVRTETEPLLMEEVSHSGNPASACRETEEELSGLFGRKVKLEPVEPGALRYDGHGKRFVF